MKSDIRPYVTIRLFGMCLLGLLDSGASVSCLSGNAAKMFLSKNIPYKHFHNFVEAAGGQQYKILGYIDSNVEYKTQNKRIRFYIIPDLKQDLYLGIDFWHSFGLTNRIFGKDMNEFNRVEELNQICIENVLNVKQRDILNKTIAIFPDFEKEGLGKTNILEHVIELVPGTRPIKQRYFSA